MEKNYFSEPQKWVESDEDHCKQGGDTFSFMLNALWPKALLRPTKCSNIWWKNSEGEERRQNASALESFHQNHGIFGNFSCVFERLRKDRGS